MSKEAMKLAQKWQQTDWNTESPMSADFAVSEANDVIIALMDALREALAQPEQESIVALLLQSKQNHECNFGPSAAADWIYSDLLDLLDTDPSQRQPLTEAEYTRALGPLLGEMVCSAGTLRRVVRALEAAIKDKT